MQDEQPEFDQGKAEDVVMALLETRLGYPVEMFESFNAGVVAFARLDAADLNKIDLQDLAAAIANETGLAVDCIANTDWSFDDAGDEEATFVAFANAPDDYKEPWRNLIEPVTPQFVQAGQNLVRPAQP